MITLSTSRLQLTPFRAADLDELHDFFRDIEVARYLLDGQQVPREWVEDEIGTSIERFDSEGAGLWATRLVGESEICGIVGFRPFFDPPELQLLYAFLPSRWGQGLAIEAASAAMQYAFEELGFDEIRAATDEPNEASIRVLERLGFGQWKSTEGEPHRTLFYRIERADWSARRVG